MRGERPLLRLGEYLVSRACQRLPQDIREERYREWAAELPAIQHDPQMRGALRRTARMLAYAADTVRGTAMTAAGARCRSPREAAAFTLWVLAGLAVVAWDIWATVRAPGHVLTYGQLAWGLLLLALPVSLLVRSTARVVVLIFISGTLAGVVVYLWNAAQAPADWVNYVVAACLLLLLMVRWLASRRARSSHAGSPGPRRVAG